VRNRLGIGGTYNCTCSASTGGSCSFTQTENTVSCGKPGDTCNGHCDLEISTGGGAIQ